MENKKNVEKKNGKSKWNIAKFPINAESTP
jgi:hypothetical protein